MRSSILFGLYRWSVTRNIYQCLQQGEDLFLRWQVVSGGFGDVTHFYGCRIFGQGLEHIFVGGVVADSQNKIVIFFFELAGNFRAFVVIGRFYFDHFVSLNDLQFLLYTDRNKFVG